MLSDSSQAQKAYDYAIPLNGKSKTVRMENR